MRQRIPIYAAGAVLATALAIPAQMQLLVPTSQPQATQARVVSASCTPMSRPQRGPTAAEKEAAKFRQPQIRGRNLLRAVGTVTRELDWHDDLDEAMEDAEETGKPILWIHALGDLKGYT